MLPVSVVIVTKNEEVNIRDALQSIGNKAEIVIVDSYSTDRTTEICKEFTDKIFQREWHGYASQKQTAIELASNPWVFILDSDERFTDSLWEEIAAIVNGSQIFTGYYVSRKNYFLGKWIRHSGWWPDYTLRLFKKDEALMETRKVHEKVFVHGKVGYLQNYIEHYSYRTVSDYIRKMETYSTLAAEELKDNGIRAGISKMVINPLFTFMKMFFFRLGFLDGKHGFMLSVLYSHYTFLKYLKLWEETPKK